MAVPRVAICIVSTNEAHNLLGVIESLARSEHERFAVYICENGGEAGFVRSAEALAGAAFLSPGPRHAARAEFALQPHGQQVVLLSPGDNLGYAGGTNHGIRAAEADGGCDAVWVLNPDTFPEPRALAALVEHQQAGDYGIVGSRMIFTANGLVQCWAGNPWSDWWSRGRRPFGYLQPGDAPADVAAVERDLHMVSGASMYVSRAYLDEVGLMDEGFFVFCEDSDWSLRRGRFGLGYAHGSIIHHVHGATSGSSTDKRKVSPFNVYLTTRNRVRVAQKQLGGRWPLAALLIFVDLGRFLVRGAFDNYLTALKGFAAGLRGETGKPPMLTRPRVQARPAPAVTEPV